MDQCGFQRNFGRAIANMEQGGVDWRRVPLPGEIAEFRLRTRRRLLFGEDTSADPWNWRPRAKSMDR
eukprot:4272536-Pyramimonas_sp.AAC.1